MGQGYKVIAADINIDGPINEIGCHQVIQVDLSSEESIQRFKQEMGEQPVDVLVNVAGTYTYNKSPSTPRLLPFR